MRSTADRIGFACGKNVRSSEHASLIHPVIRPVYFSHRHFRFFLPTSTFLKRRVSANEDIVVIRIRIFICISGTFNWKNRIFISIFPTFIP